MAQATPPTVEAKAPAREMPAASLALGVEHAVEATVHAALLDQGPRQPVVAHADRGVGLARHPVRGARDAVGLDPGQSPHGGLAVEHQCVGRRQQARIDERGLRARLRHHAVVAAAEVDQPPGRERGRVAHDARELRREVRRQYGVVLEHQHARQPALDREFPGTDVLEVERLVAAAHVARREAALDERLGNRVRVVLEHELERNVVARELGLDVRDAIGEAAHRQYEDGVDERVDGRFGHGRWAERCAEGAHCREATWRRRCR